MTDPLDRLSALRSGAVPPLPGAEAARARGRQRTRRTRAVLAGAGAVVAVVAASAASALTGGTDRTLPPPVASTAPQSETPLQAALLDADDVTAVLQQAWVVRSTEDLPFVVELPGCTSSDVVGEQALRFFTGPDAEVLGTRVDVFSDAGAARQHYAELTGGTSLCGADQLRTEPPTGPAESVRGAVEDATFGPRPFVLSRVGRAVVLLMTYGADLTPGLVDRADAEVRAALPEAEPEPEAAPTADPSTPADLSDVLLTPQEADAATGPGWREDPSAVGEGPVLDPCGEGGVPRQEAVTGGTGGGLRLERETGGSGLYQSVLSYETPRDAEAAFGELADAVRRCPRAPARQAPPDHAVERSVVPVRDDAYLVRERYCGPQCTDLYTTYVLVARTGRLLSTASFSIAEDGDPGDEARALLLATADRLVRAEAG